MSSLNSDHVWNELKSVVLYWTIFTSDRVQQERMLELLDGIIEQDLSVLEQRFGEYGFTPLNYVCSNIKEVDRYWVVIERLFQRCPNALTIADDHGCLPLHYICITYIVQRERRDRFDLIKLFVEIYPDSVRAKTRRNQTPLHLAVESGLSFTAIKFLYEQYPQALWDQDDEGMTPLHIACGKCSRSYDHELLPLLYDPQAARKLLRRGITPFQSACLAGNVPAVQFLLERDPVLFIAVNEQNATPWESFVCENKRRTGAINHTNWKIFDLTTWNGELLECLQTASLALVGELLYKHKSLSQMNPNVIAKHFAKLLEKRPFPTQQQLQSPDITSKKPIGCKKRGKRIVFTKLKVFNHLTTIMCQPTFQGLLQRYRNMIRFGKSHYLWYVAGNKAKNVAVLKSAAGGAKKNNNVHILFQYLRANPIICDRLSCTSSVSLANDNEPQQQPRQSKRGRKRKVRS